MKTTFIILLFVIFVVKNVISEPWSGYSYPKPYSYAFSTYHHTPTSSYRYLSPSSSLASDGFQSKHGYDYPKPSVGYEFEDGLQYPNKNQYYSNYKDYDYHHYYYPKQRQQQHQHQQQYYYKYPAAISYQSQTLWPSKKGIHKPFYGYKSHQHNDYPSTVWNEWKPSYSSYKSYSNNGWYDEDIRPWNSGGWIK